MALTKEEVKILADLPILNIFPEEWIIFVDLVQKSLVRQNITTGPTMCEFMERVLKGDDKAN